MKHLITFILLFEVLLSATGVTAEEAEVKIAKGAVYGALNYYSIQVDDTVADMNDPGVFEGAHPLEFDQGDGFGLSLGATAERDHFFVGSEFEFVMSSTDIANDFPGGTIYEGFNSLDQLSLNLNLLLGTDIGNRRFRPYVFGGIGYTEVELIGHYGLATISLDEGYADTFSYHAGVEADLRLFKGLYLNAAYRYYETTDVEIEVRDRSIEFSNSGQMVHLGIKYIFFPPPVEYRSLGELWSKSAHGNKF
jgi:opacity protein-like surface antigen